MIDRRELLKVASAVAFCGLTSFAPSRADSTRSGKLLFVHGRSQQGKNPETLKNEWFGVLRGAATSLGLTLPGSLQIAFPYYGDVLDKFTREFAIPLTSTIHARGSAVDDEFLAFQAEFADALRQRAGITDEQVDAEYGADPNARGPLNWKWVQAILRAIDKNGSGMNQKTLEVFTRDVFLYATRPGVRDEIDRIVAAKLTEDPTIVVSHSLGTVVAYSVLSTDRRALQVPLLVTLGSPLGVRAVRDQFRPLRSPSAVGTWYNAFDPRDVVALYPLDRDNFPVEPAIENNGTVKNRTDNRHGIAGYLDDAGVVKRILDALSS
jgi:hypothetical protein